MSALAVAIHTLEVVEYPLFLGGGWPDDVRFPRRSGDSPVYSLHLRAYCCVKEGYQSLSASAVTINSLEVAEYPLFLGGGWPDDVRFPCRSGDSPPLVIVWAEDALIVRQTLMM